MIARELTSWTGIAIGGAALFAIFLTLGYGLIALCFLFVFGAMAGGAFLYWMDGEGEETPQPLRERDR